MADASCFNWTHPEAGFAQYYRYDVCGAYLVMPAMIDGMQAL